MKSGITDFQAILHNSKASLLSIYISMYFAEISDPIRLVLLVAVFFFLESELQCMCFIKLLLGYIYSHFYCHRGDFQVFYLSNLN